MAVERIHRQTQRSAKELARLRAIREKFQREKPSLEELLATGEYDGPVPQGAYLELRRLMHALRAERERLGLSLADVAKRTGIDKAALSRLETGRQINPTIDTLWRYALAVNAELAWAVVTQGSGEPDRGAPAAGGGKRPAGKASAKSRTAKNTNAQSAPGSSKKAPRR
ncbi:MAG: helix-turn-helix transcriptional regulator [Gemmataceae bacterium]|nr:helix-turn-helix transcriptional regulator [Gemmataceae bacterium]